MKTYKVKERYFIDHYLIDAYPIYYHIWDIEDGEIEAFTWKDNNNVEYRLISSFVQISENNVNDVRPGHDWEMLNYLKETISNKAEFCIEISIEQLLTHEKEKIRNFVKKLMAEKG